MLWVPTQRGRETPPTGKIVRDEKLIGFQIMKFETSSMLWKSNQCLFDVVTDATKHECTLEYTSRFSKDIYIYKYAFT